MKRATSARMGRKSLTGTILLSSPTDGASIRHLTGFHAPDPFTCVVEPGRTHLIVSELEASRAQATAVGRRIQVHTAAGLIPTRSERRKPGATVLALLHQLKCRNVSVTRSCPVGLVRALEAHTIAVDVQDCMPTLARDRKKPEEIAAITAAQRAAVMAYRHIEGIVRAARIGRNNTLHYQGKPLTSELLLREIGVSLMQNGCVCEEAIASAGVLSAQPHSRGEGPILAGEPMVLDIFPRNLATGYWGDLTRTILKGKPSADLRQMYRAVRQAQADALERVKAGVALRTVHRAAADALEAAGFATDMAADPPQGYIHSTGHGVGLDIHEAPAVADVAGKLKAGQIITVEPGLYYPELGGIRIEDTVLVTHDGYKLLAPCRKVFAIP